MINHALSRTQPPGNKEEDDLGTVAEQAGAQVIEFVLEGRLPFDGILRPGEIDWAVDLRCY